MHPATELLLAMPVEQDNSITYGQHFNYPGRRCLRRPGRHQRGRDARGYPVLAQWSRASPLDRRSSDGWLSVCDPALHHGLHHESKTGWSGDNGSSAYTLGSAHCACARPRTPASAEDLDCASLQAEPFVAEGHWNSDFRNFLRAGRDPHVVRTSSFDEPRRHGVKARDWGGGHGVPGAERLAVREEKKVAGFHRPIATLG